MHWDLNYFKYYFLKLARIPFDEQALEDDYDALTSFLMQAPSRYFMYRDFQSRNILLPDQEPFFIDYQGGRRGALQYDVASLLYDSKADLPEEIRSELVDFYLENLESYVPGKQEEFLRFYPAFILIRILQALGAYGFRGYYEQKSHFLQSVPYALENLRTLTTKMEIGVPLPELFHVLDHLIRQPSPGIRLPASGIGYPASDLTVSIASFAYKDGIPRDPGGHGGGFVFDCRALPNPGRFEQYQQLTGKDKPVIDFLVDQREVDEFLNYVNELVGQAVRSYLQREFTHLSVAFGCTGGQHRSVYCAEKLASYLAKTFPIKVSVNHLSIVTS